MKTVKERFYEKINKDVVGTGCWMWTGAVSSSTGYGKFRDKDHKVVNAHRWIYEHINGFSSRKLHVDHVCRCRSCVNPAHLELVSPSENFRRGITAMKHIVKNRKPRGPSKPASEVMNTQVKFRATESFKEKMDRRAWKLRLSTGQYLRNLVEEDLKRKLSDVIGRD